MVTYSFAHVVSLVCALLLATLMYREMKITGRKLLDSRMTILFSSTILFAIVDGILRMMTARRIPATTCSLYNVMGILYLLGSVTAYAWFLYVTRFFDRNFYKKPVIIGVSCLPLISIFTMLVINTVNPIFFYFDEELIFHKTELTYITYAPALAFFSVPFILLFIFTLPHRSRESVSNLIVMGMIALIPFVASMLQLSHTESPYLVGGFMFVDVLMYSSDLYTEFEQLLMKEREQGRQRSRELESVVRSLSDKYIYVSTVNLDTYENKVHKITDELAAELDDTVDMTRADTTVRFFANKFVHKSDREHFLHQMTRENILKHLSREGSVVVDYRIMVGRRVYYYETRLIHDDTQENRNIILSGTYSVDEMRRREIKQKEMLDKALKKAESASSAKSAFLSRMSHDIRTPLNGVIGMIEVAKRNTDDPSRMSDCLTKIDDASKHLIALVNDVLDMTKIESNKIEIANEPFDLIACLDNCASMVEGQLYGRQIKFVRDYSKIDHNRVLGDELHIRQILVNILGNSVKFTPDGGTITFRAYESKATKKMATYRFEMEDTGRGMSPEFLEHIWEPFAQEKSEGRSKYEGTGLGMTITKNLTELMGGTIIVKSKEGVGTAFSLTLALNIDPAVGHEKAEEIDQELKNARILVVEDNALNLEIMLELLAGDTIELESAENGQIAFDMFEKSEPGYYDAILMDIMMPVMDGCEATKHIRALERPDAKEIPIIALTANAFDDDKRRTMAAGMNAHLTKPIDVEQTLQTLASFINKKRG